MKLLFPLILGSGRSVGGDTTRLIASLIGQRNNCIVETCAGVDSQSVGDLEVIKYVDANIRILRPHGDRDNRVIGIVDEVVGKRHDEIRRQRA